MNNKETRNENDDINDYEKQTPYQRLKGLFKHAFSRVDINDDRISPPPKKFIEWGQSILFLTTSGALLGGLQEWAIERRTKELPVPPECKTQIQIAKFKAEARTKSLSRIMNGMVRSGMWCGLLGGIFLAVQGLSEFARNKKDPYNTVFGAWTAGSTLGFYLGGPGFWNKLSSVSLGFVVCGLIGYPIGMCHVYLINNLAEKEMNNDKKIDKHLIKKEENKRPYPVRDYNVVSSVIDKLESNLNKKE